MSDSDFWWRYRVIGCAGNGNVLYNTTVELCAQPPLKEDLAQIEQAHERALAYPGVRTATTIGPMRESRRVKP